MAKPLSEKAQELFDKANTTEMKVLYQLAKDTLLSKIEDEQRELGEKFNTLQKDKEAVSS